MSQPTTPHRPSTSSSTATTPTSQHRRNSSILTPEQQKFLESRLLNRSAVTSPSSHTNSSPTSSHHTGSTTDAHVRNTSAQIESLLAQRSTIPDSAAVYEAGIHKDDVSKVAPRLHTTKQALEKNLKKAALHEKLSNRPTIDELQGQGILKNKLTGSTVPSSTSALQQRADRVELSAPRSDDTMQQLAQQTGNMHLNNTNNHSKSNNNTNTKPTDHELIAEQELYQRRSKMFHLTRILLRAAVALHDAQLITAIEKGALKDLIVDSHPDVLAVAEQFDLTNDSETFKTHLIQVAKLAATT